MAIDISGLSYFMPIFGFLFVFVIVYALLHKTKILGGNAFINVLISLIIAVVFSTMSGVPQYIQKITPWFVVLVIAIFFILLIVGMSQSKIDVIMKPWFVWIFIVLLILVFLVAAINVFSGTLGPVLDDIWIYIDTESRVVGGAILLIIAVIVAWVITRK